MTLRSLSIAIVPIITAALIGCGVGGGQGALVEEPVPGSDDAPNPEGQEDVDPNSGIETPPQSNPDTAPGTDPNADPLSDPDPEVGPISDPADPNPPLPANGSVRFIKLLTTTSPSWVAWNEIQIVADGHNLARDATATASASHLQGAPARAIDGDDSTPWNSGVMAPASITLELPADAQIQGIRARVAQMPEGATVHQLLLAGDDGVFSTLHTFEGTTRDGDWLEVSLESPENLDPPEPTGPPEPPGPQDPPVDDPVGGGDDQPVRDCPTWSAADIAQWNRSGGASLAPQQPADSARFNVDGDAFIWIDREADLNRCGLVDVVMKVTGAHNGWQIYWAREDEDFSEERSRRFTLFADQEWHRYVFDVSDHPGWRGQLSQLRIDPSSGAGSVEIRSVRIRQSEGDYPPPLSFPEARWLHNNVSGWAETSRLSEVRFSGPQICLEHDRSDAWSPVSIGDGVMVSANPWVFIWRPALEGVGGTWYGTTWEWMRPGQTCKNSHSVAGDHIKQPPYHRETEWRPSSGETLYFMVSGLARSHERNQQERSNPLRIRWP